MARVSKNWWVVAALIFVFLIADEKIHRLNQQIVEKERAAELIRDSLDAARDTTRLIGRLGDSLDVYQRRAIQSEIKVDSLDRALKLQTKANANLKFVISEYNSSASAPVTEHAGVRTAVFEDYRRPYSWRASVVFPPIASDQPASADVQIRLDTARVSVRVGCGIGDGLRQAQVTVLTSDWLSTLLDEVQQSPGVCNPSPPPQPWFDNKKAFGLGVISTAALFFLLK